MQRKFFIRRLMPAITLFSFSLYSHLVAAQQTKESKIRRSGSTNALKITDLIAVKRNNLLTVQASFINESSSRIQYNYRFKWLDDSGIKVSDDEVWKPQSAFGGQTFELTGVAPTPMATDFVIELNGFG